MKTIRNILMWVPLVGAVVGVLEIIPLIKKEPSFFRKPFGIILLNGLYQGASFILIFEFVL